MEYNNIGAALIKLKKACRNYIRDVTEISVRAVLLLISTTVLSLLVLYFYSILWHILLMSYSGKKFSMLYPKATGVISNIVNNDLIELSIHTTFSAFVICLIISAICQVSYITRFLYYPRSIITKLLFWGIPLGAVVSMYINDQIELAHWSHTMPVAIVPTLCVFTYCFKFSEALLPEFGTVINKIFHGFIDFFSPTPTRNPNT